MYDNGSYTLNGIDIDNNIMWVTSRGNGFIYKFVFDRQSPSISIIGNIDHKIISNKSDFQGLTFDSLTNITSIEYKFEDEDWRGCSDMDGTFDSLEEQFTCDLSSFINEDGEYQIQVRSTDSRTNTSDPEEITFIYDTTPPDPTKYNGYDSGINVYSGLNVTTNPYIIKLNATDNLSGVSKVEFYIDGDLVCTDEEVNEEGLYECLWDTDKYHTDIMVRMYDRVGNMSEFEVLGVNVKLASTGFEMLILPYVITNVVLLLFIMKRRNNIRENMT